MKRMILTGATGFLGRRIKMALDGEYEIYAPGRDELIITDEVLVQKVFDNIGPDIVVHAAAISSVGVCERNPELSEKVNVLAPEILAKAAEKHRAKFIFCSSDQIYMGLKSLDPHKESEMAAPAGIYGRHKLKAEEKCLMASPDAVCLRLSWMYDWRALSEDEHSDLFRNMLGALRNKEQFWCSCKDYRGVTYVREIIAQMPQIFLLPGGVYNCGSENRGSMFEAVTEFLEMAGIDISILKRNEGASYPWRNIRMNGGKLRSYGIEFSQTADGLLRAWNEYENRAL